MENSSETTSPRIPVRDKRRTGKNADEQEAVQDAPVQEAQAVEAEIVESPPDYLDDLRRVQADFDNYRRRMMKEQAGAAQRATGRLIERLLPVLDNFERALEHDAPPGVEMIFKEFKGILESEGLATIDAAGSPFDPRLHEAVDSHEDHSVTDITVAKVYRTGYRVGDQVVRAAMVSVARPPDGAAPAAQAEDVQSPEVLPGNGAEG